jgi:hypothetical protein
MSEPGDWTMASTDGAALRQHLRKGGLIILDDIERDRWDNMATNMRRTARGCR